MLRANYMSKIPLGIYTVIGEYMHRSSKFLKTFRVFNILAILIVTFFIVSGPFKEKKSKRYAEYMESFSVSIHTQAKYLFFIYNKPRIEKLLIELAKISWHPKDFDNAFLVADQKFQKLVRVAIFAFMIQSVVIVEIFLLRPAYQNSPYILETWHSNSIVLATIVSALQYYVLILVPSIVMGFDCLYLALCAEIVIQARRLKYRMESLFRNIGNDESSSHKNEIRHLIRCHEHLLRTFRYLQEIYSFTLLFHYFITLSSNCAELYTFLSGSKLEVGRLLSVVVVVSEFAFYTFPAEAITVEFENISTALYMSDWYKSSIDCQKLLLFTIMRAQLRAYLQGGGIIDINLSAFVSVLKLSFSVYTLLSNTVYS